MSGRTSFWYQRISKGHTRVIREDSNEMMGNLRCLGNASKCIIRDIGREQLPRQPLPPSAPIGMRRANIAEATRWINLPGNTRPWTKQIGTLNSMYSGGRGFCVCTVEFRDLEIVVYSYFGFTRRISPRFHSPPRPQRRKLLSHRLLYVCDVSLL
jgi:hypothetical protein